MSNFVPSGYFVDEYGQRIEVVDAETRKKVSALTEEMLTTEAKAELAALCPEALTDPDVKILYKPGVTEIAAQEYININDFDVAYFPDVVTVGIDAFRDLSNKGAKILRCAIFPKATVVKSGAFKGCVNLKYAYFPSLVETVWGTFTGTGIIHADFPALETLGEYTVGSVFAGCKSLVSINMPKLKSVNVKGGEDFANNPNLNNVNLPELEAVAIRTFRNCTSLTKLDLPKVTGIGRNAFVSSGIETLILRSETVATLDYTNAFDSTPIASGTGYIYVPAALIEDYKAATNWSTYAAQFRAIEDYPEICDPTMDETITKGEAVALVGTVEEKIAGINKAIPFAKQGDANYKCALTFAEAVALVKNGQNQVNATLTLTNMDASTMTLKTECYYASYNEVGLALNSSEVKYIRVNFVMQDGSITKLMYNQDDTITVVTE